MPCGAVAALAPWPIKGADARHAPWLADYLSSQPTRRWPPAVGEIAARYWWRRPDLISAAGPLLQWTQEEHSADTLYAVKAVAESMLKHGVLLHPGYADPELRSHIDLMSWTLTCRCHSGDRAWPAEHHTPNDAARLLTLLAVPARGDPPSAGSSRTHRRHQRHVPRRCPVPAGAGHRSPRVDGETPGPEPAARGRRERLLSGVRSGRERERACGNTLSKDELLGRAPASRAEAEVRRGALYSAAAEAAGH